jgi:hypothetical protein
LDNVLEGDADSEKVGALICLASGDEFWCQEARCAGDVVCGGSEQGSGATQVDEHAGAILADEHVGGFEVAVTHTDGVQNAKTFERVAQRTADRLPACSADELSEVGAIDEIRGVEGATGAVDGAPEERRPKSWTCARCGWLKPRSRLNSERRVSSEASEAEITSLRAS